MGNTNQISGMHVSSVHFCIFVESLHFLMATLVSLGSVFNLMLLKCCTLALVRFGHKKHTWSGLGKGQVL